MRRHLGPVGQKLVRLVMIAVVVAAGAELGARLDDWVFLGISPLSNPTYDSELRLQDAGFIRGRPNGHFRRWQLNEYGFVGPPNELLPNAGCVRVVVLGASETFGLYERPGHEFVSVLRNRLSGHGCIEVINASIVGMSVGSARAYWRGWVSQFHPHIAVIYPNPLLSLHISNDSDNHCAPPAPRTAAVTPVVAPNGLRARILDRLRDAIDKPQWLVDLQIEREIERTTRNHEASWVLDSVPPRCVDAFEEDVQSLLEVVRASGAVPLVCTHASSLESSKDNGRRNALWLRQWIPRLSAPAQITYHQEANDYLRSLGTISVATVFDADAVLSVCDACFEDSVHFSTEGADRLASALAPLLLRMTSQVEHALQ